MRQGIKFKKMAPVSSVVLSFYIHYVVVDTASHLFVTILHIDYMHAVLSLCFEYMFLHPLANRT